MSMNENSTITVEPGGYLIIKNNTTISSCSPTAMPFNGLFIQGNLTSQIYSSQGLVNYFNHGRLTMENSTIEGAVTGVYSEFAGIIECTNSTFFDCENSVYVESLGNPNLYPNALTAINGHNPAAIRFQKCDFKFTKLWGNDINFANRIHAFIGAAPYVQFSGCKFSNESLNKYDYNERGTGIYSDNSTVIIESESGNYSGTFCYTPNPPNARESTFEKLSFGLSVPIASSSNDFSRLGLNSAKFTDCFRPVNIFNGTGYVIGKCQFKFDDGSTYYNTPPTGLVRRDIYMGGSKDFVIVSNSFESYYPTHHIRLWGTGVDRSTVYKNTFIPGKNLNNQDGLNNCAIEIDGNSNNKSEILNIDCNTFTKMASAIVIRDASFESFLGKVDVGLANIFSLRVATDTTVYRTNGPSTQYVFNNGSNNYDPKFFSMNTQPVNNVNQNYTLTQSGIRCITDIKCTDGWPNLKSWNIPFTVGFAEVAEVKTDFKVILTARNIRILSPNHTIESFSVTDAKGRTFFNHGTTSNEEIAFNTNLSPGVYFIRIVSGNLIQVERAILFE